MAAHDLTVLHAPQFPQVLSSALTSSLLRLVEMAEARAYSKPSCRQQVRPEADVPRYWYPRYQQWLSLNELAYLTRCYYSDEHCDCKATATVHILPNGQEFCERHFREVSRG